MATNISRRHSNGFLSFWGYINHNVYSRHICYVTELRASITAKWFSCLILEHVKLTSEIFWGVCLRMLVLRNFTILHWGFMHNSFGIFTPDIFDELCYDYLHYSGYCFLYIHVFARIFSRTRINIVLHKGVFPLTVL